MLVVFSDQSSQSQAINAQEINQLTDIARRFGCRVYAIPKVFDTDVTANDALTYVPFFNEPTPAIWIGFIPIFQRYVDLYEAAIKKNVKLVNSPDEHQRVMEFDRFYPKISDLTPKSIVIDGGDTLDEIAKNIAFPVFVKGTIKSDKDKGWDAVTAFDIGSLKKIVQQGFANTLRSRGKVIIRQLVKLRTVATDPNGFPIGREYRAFVYQNKILDYGFYWDQYRDSFPLLDEDKRAIEKLIIEVSHRLQVPFMSVDVAQLETGEWIVIEVGDGQFSGLSQIDPLALWSKLVNLVT